VNAVHLVVPAGMRDPRRPSGGNVYDRCLARGLRDRAWTVHEWAVAGDWPRPDAAARAGLERCLEGIPDDAVVLLDGLVASSVPDLLARHRDRLRHVVLVHMPLGHGGAGESRHTERVALTDARAVLTTSNWTRDWLVATYALAAGLVHVARPGVDDAVRSLGTPTGGALLCVAAVIPPKGQDDLVAALAAMADLPWTCTFVGTLERDPAFVAGLVRAARAAGIEDRVHLVGTATRSEVDTHYRRSDLLVLPSRAETYGMVAAEALSHAVPVVATDVGGVPEAFGAAVGGDLPGCLVPADDPVALAAALRGWLADADLRQRWRGAAMSRSARLPGWPATAARVADVLAGVAT
jgi:glycosyltransferase involved in cell wall biosynthesis